MSRKQFDRMELLTDETEVDRTFLYSKLHAIVHVPFSLPLSLSLSLSLCTSSVVPLAPYATPSFRSNHRIRPGAGCKYLLLQKSWHAGSSKNSKKSASGMHAALFQAQIISDLSRFNPGSRIWATSFHLPVRRLNRIFFYFSFFLFSSSFPRQL